MTEDSPSLHAAECRHEGCEWNTMAFSLIELYGELEDHLKAEHDYSQDDWQNAREKLAR